MYLLDTSVVSIAVKAQSPKHSAVRKLLDESRLRADEVFISAVSIAEVELGFVALSRRAPPVPISVVEEVRQRMLQIKELAAILDVTRHVASDHAKLKVAYAQKFAPTLFANGKLKGRPVELWHSNWNAPALNVTENDLWIAATAITHDLILLSDDNDHVRMSQADPRLQLKSV